MHQGFLTKSSLAIVLTPLLLGCSKVDSENVFDSLSAPPRDTYSRDTSLATRASFDLVREATVKMKGSIKDQFKSNESGGTLIIIPEDHSKPAPIKSILSGLKQQNLKCRLLMEGVVQDEETRKAVGKWLGEMLSPGKNKKIDPIFDPEPSENIFKDPEPDAYDDDNVKECRNAGFEIKGIETLDSQKRNLGFFYYSYGLQTFSSLIQILGEDKEGNKGVVFKQNGLPRYLVVMANLESDLKTLDPDFPQFVTKKFGKDGSFTLSTKDSPALGNAMDAFNKWLSRAVITERNKTWANQFLKYEDNNLYDAQVMVIGEAHIGGLVKDVLPIQNLIRAGKENYLVAKFSTD